MRLIRSSSNGFVPSTSYVMPCSYTYGLLLNSGQLLWGSWFSSRGGLTLGLLVGWACGCTGLE